MAFISILNLFQGVETFYDSVTQSSNNEMPNQTPQCIGDASDMEYAAVDFKRDPVTKEEFDSENPTQDGFGKDDLILKVL